MSVCHPRTLYARGWICLLVLFSLAALCARASEENDHGEHLFEFVGIYEAHDHEHEEHGDGEEHDEEEEEEEEGEEHHDEVLVSLSLFQDDGDEFSEAYVLFACMEVPDGSDDSLHEAEEEVEEFMEGGAEAEAVNNFDTLSCTNGTALYNISLTSVEAYGLHIVVELPAEEYVALLMEHSPSEFLGDGQAFLSLADGEELTAANTNEHDHDDDDDDEPWRLAIIASFLTALPSLLGILFLVPFLPNVLGNDDAVAILLSATSGVLIGAAVFLVLPEGYLLINESESESDAAGRWGGMICGAFFLGFLAKLIIALLSNPGPSSSSTGAASGDEEKDAASPAESNIELGVIHKEPRGAAAEKQKALAPPQQAGAFTAVSAFVLVGDFLHNFVDGIVIAAAFDSCSSTLGWEITAITIAHEAPQEIGDFITLVTKGGCSYWQALTLNGLGALSAVLGAVVFLASDPTDVDTGMALTFGGAVYIFIAAVELPGALLKDVTSATKLAARIAAFAMGCVIIGLILLDHEHCHAHGHEEGGEDDGHNH